MFVTIIIFILILGLLVFVHELGHFIMARKTGMPVEEFGIGFPPRIWSFKKGETLYSLNLIPLGGFVKITGENGEDKNNENAFQNKTVWQRFVVLIAGVVMNVLLAFVVLSIGFMVGLPSVVDDTLPSNARVSNEQLQIIEVVSDSPAEMAELELGDVVLSINGQSILSSSDLQKIVAASEGNDLDVVILRGSKELSVSVTPQLNEDTDKYMIGVGITDTAIVSYPWYQAIWEGFVATGLLLWQIISIFGLILFNLFTKGSLIADISGPLGIAVMTGQVVDLGYSYVLQFIAMLSLNLAIINIIPFPALDGGKIFFLLIEKIKGSPINQKVENLIHNFGFLILILLIVVVTYRDVLKFGGKILGAFKQMF